MNGLKIILLQLNACVMEASCWLEGGPTTIGDPATAPREGVGF